MDRKVLITGSRGYIGTALIESMEGLPLDLKLVDDFSREEYVEEIGGASLTPDEMRPVNYNVNLANTLTARSIIKNERPDTIIHLASQPSGPYSEIDHAHRIDTQVENLKMLINILTAVKDYNVDAEIIVTTTTGIPGAPDGPITESPMANLAGSTYHVSRGFDSANLNLAARQWGFKILEFRTSIVYGTRVDRLATPITRLDWDFIWYCY